jgi:hypothetical protein
VPSDESLLVDELEGNGGSVSIPDGGLCALTELVELGFSESTYLSDFLRWIRKVS